MDKYANYLRDLGELVKEYAREAIAEAKKDPDDAYKAGYVMGYHRIVTLMQQQADGFGIPLEEIRLHDIEEEDFFG